MPAAGGWLEEGRALFRRRMRGPRRQQKTPHTRCRAGLLRVTLNVVEAANFAKRYDDQSRRWFDRKAARTCGVLATKALACKLAKAAWHVMSGNVAYDAARVFGRVAESQVKGLVQALQD